MITFHFIHRFVWYEYTFFTLSVAVTLFALLFSGTDNSCSAFKTLKMSDLTSLSIPVHICLMWQCKYDMKRLDIIVYSSMYLVNNVVPWLTSCKNEQPVENLSSLFDQLLPTTMVVSFTLQTSHLCMQLDKLNRFVKMTFYLLSSNNAFNKNYAGMVQHNNIIRSQVKRGYVNHKVYTIIHKTIKLILAFYICMAEK